MINRFLVSLCALALILSAGCSGELQVDQSESPLAQSVTLQLMVEPNLSAAAQIGLARFCEKAAEISEGEMQILVTQSEDLLQALDEGCDMVFAPNAELARANGSFNSYTSPFYFRDYNHLTLTLNSQSFYDIICDENISLTGSVPLAAFYDGNSYFVSTRNQYLDTVDQFLDNTVNICEGEDALVFSETLEAFGAQVRERSSEYLLVNIGRNRDNAIMECDTTTLTQLDFSERVKSLVVCRSFHRARINWLMLSQDTKEILTERQLAVLSEAAAYALAANDEYVLSLEKDGEEYLDELGASFTSINYGEFCAAVDEALHQSIHYNVFWNWQQHDVVRNLALSQN